MNITCVAKAEILFPADQNGKPIEGGWETIGVHLRDLSRLWFRMLNSAVTAAHLAHAQGEPISTPTYEAVTRCIEDDIAWNVKAINTSAKRKKLQPRQIAAYDRRSKLEVPSFVYAVAARRAENAFKIFLKEQASGTRSIPSFRNHDSFCIREDGWEITKEGRNYFLNVKLHGGRTPWTRFAISPGGASAFEHFRRMATCEKAEKLTEINPLTDKEKKERKDLYGLKRNGTVLTPAQEARLSALAAKKDVPLGDKVKTGDLQIRWVDGKSKRAGGKGMWMAYATYTREMIAKPEIDPTRIMAVHRGMHSLLTYATVDGKAAILVPGDDILEHKRRYQARGMAFRKHRRCRGRSGIGHGTERTFREYGRLQDTEARFVETTCQQWAARIIKVAKENGCGTILVEDYASIPNELPRFLPNWPWSKLKDIVTFAAIKEGLTIKEAPAAYISLTCPQCRHVHEDNRRWGAGATRATVVSRLDGIRGKPVANENNIERGKDLSGRGDMFECVECGFRRHIDYVAVFNMILSIDNLLGGEALKKWERALRAFNQDYGSGD